MRERILDAIYKKLEENPESVNLQRQINLLNKANICTIHSFCLDVIRNNFYEIDIPSNFRIGDTTEIEMIKNDVIDEIFEEKYMENDEGFIKLIETYTDYRGDEKLQDIILGIYKYIQSNPFPEKWLEEKIEDFNIDTNEDFSNTIWGKIILQHLKDEINSMVIKLEKIRNDTLKFYELEKFSSVLQEDINNLKSINLSNWDIAYENMKSLSWTKWPVDKKVTIDLKNEAKDIRDSIKKDFSKILLKYNSKEANLDILKMYDILKEIKKLVIEFSKIFSSKKKEKNIIDFNDIEHFALKILVDENGERTEIAKKYIDVFEEILIDEYQDSNLVQEKILTSISKGNNIFMVGDVKQSIYKFRQARPELFLDKYEKYDVKSGLNVKSVGEKIQLFKNFRSRKNVLDITNLVFENIMSKKLGDVEYNEEEYLNFGADYPEPEENIEYSGIAELNIIDLKEKEDDIYKETIEEVNDNDNQERIEDAVLEARFVANKIQEILDSDYHVYDRKKGYRKVKAKDICVLLRATSVLAPIYEKEISEKGISVFSDSSSTYLESMEVQTIMSLLKIIDNPMQDIPLITVLRSNIFSFTDNDLIQIRLCDKKCSFYESMIKSRLNVDNILRHKIDMVLEKLKKWKNEEEYTPLNEFIWKLYLETGFYNYVALLPNGNLRQANLKMLFEKAKQYEKVSFKGLFSFINFIDKVKTSSGDMSAAKIVGENDDVVRIMSIHKSKGLEFPIVFLSSTGKKFNMQDLNMPILIHQDIGFGIQYIDSEKKIEYPTLTKEAIKIKSREETISEEMRVLYVALTRAKEKLIITGMSKDIDKELKSKEKMLEIFNKENLEEKLNFNLVGKYSSYLDWLELVYEYNKKREIDNIIKLKIYNKDELISKLSNDSVEEINLIEKIKDDIEKAENINEADKIERAKNKEEILTKLKWKYKYERKSKIPTKTSVTKLKEIELENLSYDIEDIINNVRDNKNGIKTNKEYALLSDKPKFMEETESLNSAQKGTIMHLCVQLLDESKNYSFDDLKEFIQDLTNRNIISKQEADSVNIHTLYKYTKSELWNDLREAREIHKEEAFYINVDAGTIFDDAEEGENILVQGIIDLYYIDKEGKVILVDYKTDYVPDGDVSKLEEKYKVQLELYKEALEQALERKVDKAMIWALNL
jgi:ATP-dependent helicase/nuclease subunit A